MKTTMKVAQLVKPGTSFEINEVPVPHVRAGDVLVNVKACGVVPNMTAVSSGKHCYPLPPLPAVYGLDCAGVVEQVGVGVTSFKNGDFSEYTTANADKLVKLPDNVSFETAARLGYIGTSYSALERAGVTSGSSVLIHGITGTLGVGATLSRRTPRARSCEG